MSLKIAYIAPGAAGMYCGNCLHDNTLARAMQRRGHDFLLVPTYTPIKTDEQNVSLRRVFFGGLNVYLQQKVPLFRHTPWVLDRLLDSPRLINALTNLNISTRAEDLGGMVVAMLQGESGPIAKELEKLVQWLEDEVQPDVVHLSNVMLIGMARRISQRLKTPVVCSVASEDLFLDQLQGEYQDQAMALIRERAADVAAFTALNPYYADRMADRMRVDRKRIVVIPHGLDLEGHSSRTAPADGPFQIGYLARVSPEKGLHLLVEAFKRLTAASGVPDIRLRAAGYLGKADRPYLEEIQGHLREWNLADRFEYVGEVDRVGKIDFLHSIDCLCMPTTYPESKGLPVLEAWANAVPVAVPSHGVFPDLIAESGAGLLCEPNDPDSLALALRRLAEDRQEAVRMGALGRQVMLDRYQSDLMADRTAAFYLELCGQVPQPAPPPPTTTADVGK